MRHHVADVLRLAAAAIAQTRDVLAVYGRGLVDRRLALAVIRQRCRG